VRVGRLRLGFQPVGCGVAEGVERRPVWPLPHQPDPRSAVIEVNSMPAILPGFAAQTGMGADRSLLGNRVSFFMGPESTRGW